jgi:hypothetical protein
MEVRMFWCYEGLIRSDFCYFFGNIVDSEDGNLFAVEGKKIASITVRNSYFDGSLPSGNFYDTNSPCFGNTDCTSFPIYHYSTAYCFGIPRRTTHPFTYSSFFSHSPTFLLSSPHDQTVVFPESRPFLPSLPLASSLRFSTSAALKVSPFFTMSLHFHFSQLFPQSARFSESSLFSDSSNYTTTWDFQPSDPLLFTRSLIASNSFILTSALTASASLVGTSEMTESLTLEPARDQSERNPALSPGSIIGIVLAAVILFCVIVFLFAYRDWSHKSSEDLSGTLHGDCSEMGVDIESTSTLDLTALTQMSPMTLMQADGIFAYDLDENDQI